MESFQQAKPNHSFLLLLQLCSLFKLYDMKLAILPLH